MPTNQTWGKWIKPLATGGDPKVRSVAAMERLMKVLEDYIVRVPPITGRYNVHNRVTPINFPSLEAKEHAEGAFERYEEKKARLNQDMPGEHFLRLVALNEFRRETEPLRSEILAKCAWEAIQNGQVALICACFKTTLSRTIKFLVRDYGLTRKDLSVIWGGDAFEGIKPFTDEEIKGHLTKFLAGEPVSNKIIRQIERQAYPQTELANEFSDCDLGDLNLNSQDSESRQREIDRLQGGVTKVGLYTFAAGGVGLSLHDTDEFFTITKRELFTLDRTEGERNFWKSKKTGKIYHSSPRRTFAGPTWSAQDYVQGLGRGHRSIFSLSHTYQDILFFNDSVEESVMDIVSQNLKCLGKAVQARESWSDAIHSGRKKRTETPSSDYVTADENEFADDEDED